MYKIEIRKPCGNNFVELNVDNLKLAVERFKIESMRLIDTLAEHKELIEDVWIDEDSICNGEKQLTYIIINTKSTHGFFCGYNSFIIDFYKVD